MADRGQHPLTHYQEIITLHYYLIGPYHNRIGFKLMYLLTDTIIDFGNGGLLFC